ncbi:RloB family protein [Saccharibacillus sacchari]|uniref:RloB family protein n=1 Tax=Saccharibacillus sacchari TaxID=456493 RepID=A0ACC6PFK1_9BACL
MGSDDLFKKRKLRDAASYKRDTEQKGKDRDLFLIVCEGTKSEPQYFQGFGLSNTHMVGVGGSPLTVVDCAINEINKSKRKRSRIAYDQVWCVFDRDSFPKDNFNEAIAKAGRNDIQVAYSNEAFELWYILHFEYLNTGVNRQDYMTKLNKLLGVKYEKNEKNIHELLLRSGGSQTQAINNAKNLLKLYDPIDPESNKPSTRVHVLVEELLKYKK